MTMLSRPSTGTNWQRVATVHDLDARGCKTVHVAGRTLVLWRSAGQVYALDNRCPHMGFPLDRGTCRDGILTCHWHHARFDLASGGTFDLWADDLPVYPVEVQGDQVLIDVAQRTDPDEHRLQRLETGLERNIPLVIAKATIREL